MVVLELQLVVDKHIVLEDGLFVDILEAEEHIAPVVLALVAIPEMDDEDLNEDE